MLVKDYELRQVKRFTLHGKIEGVSMRARQSFKLIIRTYVHIVYIAVGEILCLHQYKTFSCEVCSSFVLFEYLQCYQVLNCLRTENCCLVCICSNYVSVFTGAKKKSTICTDM